MHFMTNSGRRQNGELPVSWTFSVFSACRARNRQKAPGFNSGSNEASHVGPYFKTQTPPPNTALHLLSSRRLHVHTSSYMFSVTVQQPGTLQPRLHSSFSYSTDTNISSSRFSKVVRSAFEVQIPVEAVIQPFTSDRRFPLNN